jgi:membrane-bound lytic murein transglycosylase D
MRKSLSFPSLPLIFLVGGILSLLLACAGPRQEANLASSPAEEIPETFASNALKDTLPEPLSLRESWINYRYALEAMDNGEWLLSAHYLDLALKHLVNERKDSTLRSPADSLYNSSFLARILKASDEVYPQLSDLGENAETWSPYEISLEGLEDDGEKADSASLQIIENFLDTLDLTQFSLPVELNERVLQEIHYFTERVPSFIKSSLSRKTAYDSLIYSILREYEMPEDLIYLSLVESGFKVKAYSRAKASGLWQFIPATGERFGLASNFWVDMRRHPEKATRAAAAYLSYLHKEFDDWLLAMAAYNCGEGRVRRLIKEMKADSTRDSTKAISYWELDLPKETMHYVPRILAAMIIGHFPEHYEIEIKKQELPKYDTVTITDCLPISEIAKALSISEDSVRSLNMELIKWSTPPDMASYTLRLPEGKRALFLAAYDKMDKNKFPRWHYHQVKRGEYFGSISKKYGVSISDIQAANNMKTTRLRAGQKLLIPLPAQKGNKGGPYKQVTASKKVKTYTVKQGENQASVARRYGISLSNLQKWNKLNAESALEEGQVLFVSEPAEDSVLPPQKPTLEQGKYRVQSGDTYLSIAQAFGVSPIALIEKNNGNRTPLRVGQMLVIPPPEKKVEKKDSPAKSSKNEKTAKAETKKSNSSKSNAKYYTVKSGDNLSFISQKTGVSVENLQKWNDMGTSETIYPGQKLKLEGAAKKTTTVTPNKPANKAEKKSTSKGKNSRIHVVQKGESLWDISKKYKVSIDDLVKWNELEGTRIRAGQNIYVEPQF